MTKFDFSERDKAVIRDFADGNQHRREEAVAIFHWALRECRESKKPLPRGNVYFEFMSEAVSPCPDYLLRRKYRAEILGKPFP